MVPLGLYATLTKWPPMVLPGQYTVHPPDKCLQCPHTVSYTVASNGVAWPVHPLTSDQNRLTLCGLASTPHIKCPQWPHMMFPGLYTTLKIAHSVLT